MYCSVCTVHSSYCHTRILRGPPTCVVTFLIYFGNSSSLVVNWPENWVPLCFSRSETRRLRETVHSATKRTRDSRGTFRPLSIPHESLQPDGIYVTVIFHSCRFCFVFHFSFSRRVANNNASVVVTTVYVGRTITAFERSHSDES